MISFQSFSEEIDDTELLIKELSDGIPREKLLKNSCGILYAGYEADTEAVAKGLSEAFDFPIIGATGLAILNSDGYSEASVSLTVISADDCEFCVKLSDTLTHENAGEKLTKAYEAAEREIGGAPGLVLFYVPWMQGAPYDALVDIVSRASKGVPIYGGIAADGWNFVKTKVFGEGSVYNDRAVFLLMKGNVRPYLRLERSVNSMEESKTTVTKAAGTVVYEVDGSRPTDYLMKMGVYGGKNTSMNDFLATPFVAVKKTDDGDEIKVLRSLNYIDTEDRTCAFVGRIEEGSSLMLSYISREGMEASVREGFTETFEAIAASDSYKYSTVLCSSCAARYCLIIADKEAEAKGYKGRLPEGVKLQGAYMYGEICPAKGEKTGKLYNCVNNETFAILAF